MVSRSGFSIRGSARLCFAITLAIFTVPGIVVGIFLGIPHPASAQTFSPLKPPSVPLITREPYMETWLENATAVAPGTWPEYWDTATKGMTGIAYVDGTAYLFLGDPRGVPNSMTQTALTITPTQSIFVFNAGGVNLTVDFLSPVEPTDLERLSMPLSDIITTAQSSDGNAHSVAVYFDITGQWAYGDQKALIDWAPETILLNADGSNTPGSLSAWTVTPNSPIILNQAYNYPSWGTVLWAAATANNLTTQSGTDTVVRGQFVASGSLNNTNDTNQPRAINDDAPVFAFSYSFGTVGTVAIQPFTLLLGHVRDPAVSYLGTDVSSLWKQYWAAYENMLAFAYNDSSAAVVRSNALDLNITNAATALGGPHYAALAAVTLRQAFAGTELVGTTSNPWLFLEEISSSDNVSTVDVLYPSMPAYLYTNPELVQYLIAPVVAYAESGLWPELFAPHDLGTTYPNASGHNDGGGENMPVEESANMLIMADAYMQRTTPANAAAYATAHYAIFKQWADYLLTVPAGVAYPNALDPQYQNQTDDFTGYIAHSVNLALKGIVGVGAMGQIASYAGNASDSAYYSGQAQSMIGTWAQLAQNSDSSHLLLTYREAANPYSPDTLTEADTDWSLKYNSFADKLLGLNLIPEEVLAEEAAFYKTQETDNGIPLDYRHTYTKADWEMWTAAGSDDATLRQNLIDEEYNWVNTTECALPFPDWYDTVSTFIGFDARPVMGGAYAPLLRASGNYNLNAIYADGTVFPSNGGINAGGLAYSSNILGTARSWNGSVFTFGSANALDSYTSKNIPLPPGQYSTLNLLATAVNGDQAAQTFSVTYTDGSTTTLTQGLSDWCDASPDFGEAVVVAMAYRDTSSGSRDSSCAPNLYGYSFAINGAKNVASLTLPSNLNVIVLAVAMAGAVSAPPAPLAQAASSLTAGGFTAGWYSSASAPTYYLDVSTDPAFGSFVAGYSNLNVGNGTSYGVTGLAVSTAYYYRVRAGNSFATSANSNVIAATTLALVPNAPVAAAATSVTNTGFTASWAAPSGTVLSYAIDVSLNSTFTALLTAYNNLDVGNGTSYAITGLAGGTSYYYRLRAVSTGGISGNSNTITTLTAGVPPAQPAPLLWLPFNGSLGDRGSSTTDVVGAENLNNGTPYDGTYSASVCGASCGADSLSLSGDGSYLQVVNNVAGNYSDLNFDTGQPFTVSAWFYMSPGNIILAKSTPFVNAAIPNTFALFADTAGIVHADIYYLGDTGTVQPVPSGAWTHVAVTYDGTVNWKLYINGESNSTNYYGSPSTYPACNELQQVNHEGPWTFTVGETFNGNFPSVGGGELSSSTLNGQVDEVAYWNTELSAAQVNLVYQNGASPSTGMAVPAFDPAGGIYSSAQSVAISDATPGATIYYTTDGSDPTNSPTAAPYTAPIVIAANTTVLKAIAGAADSIYSAVASSTYTVLPPQAGFTVAATPSSLTISAGGSAKATVTITPQNGFSAPVTFSCSELPSGATCTFAPATVTPAGGAATTTLSISTSVPSAAFDSSAQPKVRLLVPGGTHFAVGLCCLAWRKRRSALLTVILGLLLLPGCGGGGSSSNQPPTMATVTVTATSGTLQNTATISLLLN
jgi:hypothetical protein